MVKRIVPVSLLVIIHFTFQFALAQQSRIDSLTALVRNHPLEDTTKVNLLNELSFRVFKNQPDESRHLAEQALAVAQRLSFLKGVGESKNNLAVYHLMRGDAEVAMKFALEAVTLADQAGLYDLRAGSYSILGTVYQSQGEYSKAINYLRQAVILTKNVMVLSKAWNALGSIATAKKQYDSALYYYNKALRVMEEAKDEYRMPEVTNNIGILYSRQNKTAIALTYHFKALEVARKNNNQRGEGQALTSIGYNYLHQKKYNQAEQSLLKSIAISKKNGDNTALYDAYMAMMQLKNETGKFNEAHQYMANYYDLRESALNTEKTKEIAALEVQYEAEKKDHAIQLLKRDQEIQRLWSNILITACILCGVLFVLLYFLKHEREKKNRQILNLEIDRLTAQHKELTEKYRYSMISAGDDGSLESQNQRILKRAIEVVEKNIGDTSFDVEKMAREMGMSRTNLNRKIKEITSFPPNELIRSIRLRKAAAMILNQADSVSQISFAVGYEDHSYFSKVFKKYFGVPPSEYLQSHKGVA